MKNIQVINAWNRGQSATARSGRGALKTDGTRLWSYGLCIGRSDNEGNKIIFDFTANGGQPVSQTTSTHVGLAKRNSDAEVIRPDAARIAGLID